MCAYTFMYRLQIFWIVAHVSKFNCCKVYVQSSNQCLFGWFLVVLKLLTLKQTIHLKRLSNTVTHFCERNDCEFQPFSLCYWYLLMKPQYLLNIPLSPYRHCFYSTNILTKVRIHWPSAFLFANTFLRALDRYIDWIRHKDIVCIANGSEYLKLSDVYVKQIGTHMEHEITSTICYNVHSVVFTNISSCPMAVVEKWSQRS